MSPAIVLTAAALAGFALGFLARVLVEVPRARRATGLRIQATSDAARRAQETLERAAAEHGFGADVDAYMAWAMDGARRRASAALGELGQRVPQVLDGFGELPEHVVPGGVLGVRRGRRRGESESLGLLSAHESSPSVGRSPAATGSVVGAPGGATPGAGVPTVGEPADVDTEAAPSSGSVGGDRLALERAAAHFGFDTVAEYEEWLDSYRQALHTTVRSRAPRAGGTW